MRFGRFDQVKVERILCDDQLKGAGCDGMVNPFGRRTPLPDIVEGCLA